jgi:hypothetical protein
MGPVVISELVGVVQVMLREFQAAHPVYLFKRCPFTSRILASVQSLVRRFLELSPAVVNLPQYEQVRRGGEERESSPSCIAPP